MEQVIYADILVFFNTVITFILLLTTVLFTEARPKAARLIVASLVGGSYSLMILAPAMNLFSVFAARTAMCITLICIAFSPKKLREFIKQLAVFMLCNFLYSGIVYSVYYLAAPEYISVNNGYAYYNLSAVSLIAICSAVYACVFLIKKEFFNRKKTDDIYVADILYRKKTINVNALLDTGNNLRDVFTGSPVLVINAEKAFGLTGELFGDIENPPEGDMKLRLLPVKSVAGEKLLQAFTVDKITIYKDGREYVVARPTVAVVTDELGGDKYSALFGRDFIQG